MANACEPDGFYVGRNLAAASAAVALTALGQTAAVSVFVDPMVAELGVSRSALATAYLIGKANCYRLQTREAPATPGACRVRIALRSSLRCGCTRCGSIATQGLSRGT